MNDARTTGLFGAISAVGLTVGVLLVSSIPVGGDASTDEEIREFYDDSGDRALVVIGLYVTVASLILFAPFLVGLYRRSRIAEGDTGWASQTALVLGASFAVLAMAGAAALAAVAGAISMAGEPSDLPDTGVARFIGHLGYALLLIAGGLAAAGFLAALSWVIVRTRWLPAWTGWLGFIAAALLLVAVIFVPFAALPLWMLAVSAVLVVKRRTLGNV